MCAYKWRKRIYNQKHYDGSVITSSYVQFPCFSESTCFELAGNEGTEVVGDALLGDDLGLGCAPKCQGLVIDHREDRKSTSVPNSQTLSGIFLQQVIIQWMLWRCEGV